MHEIFILKFDNQEYSSKIEIIKNLYDTLIQKIKLKRSNDYNSKFASVIQELYINFQNDINSLYEIAEKLKEIQTDINKLTENIPTNVNQCETIIELIQQDIKELNLSEFKTQLKDLYITNLAVDLDQQNKYIISMYRANITSIKEDIECINYILKQNYIVKNKTRLKDKTNEITQKISKKKQEIETIMTTIINEVNDQIKYQTITNYNLELFENEKIFQDQITKIYHENHKKFKQLNEPTMQYINEITKYLKTLDTIILNITIKTNNKMKYFIIFCSIILVYLIFDHKFHIYFFRQKDIPNEFKDQNNYELK